MKSILTLLFIFIICTFIYETPERCEHIKIESGAVGIKTIYVTMCLKYESQVNKFNDHFESKRAEEYFK